MRLLTLKELKTVKGVPYSRATIYRMMAEGTFPRQTPLSEHRVAWLEDHVDQWIEERLAARDRRLRSAAA